MLLHRRLGVIAIAGYLMAGLGVSHASERNDSLAGRLASFLESEYSGQSVDPAAINDFLGKWAEAHFDQRKDFVHSPGSGIGAMVVDMDGNGYLDVVVAEAVSDKEASIVVYLRGRSSLQVRYIRIDAAFFTLIERTSLFRMDLTNSGAKRDLVVRFVGSGRVYPKSVDCFVVYRNRDVAGPNPYSKCFVQEAAAEDSQYVLNKWLDMNPFPVSHIVDIDDDGRYEVVVTSLVAPIDVATSAFWPDIYEWSGTSFVKANKRFSMYYNAYKHWLAEKHGSAGSAGVNSVLRRIEQQLSKD